MNLVYNPAKRPEIICTRCVLDDTVPDIWFDEKGECNYCKMHDLLDSKFPNDERGYEILKDISKKIQKEGKNKKYNIVIGVSGGTDSTYLLHLAIELGLRPLAVHLDNGWNTETSVKNLKNILQALNIDLYTYVINWKEFREILVAQLKSGLPWADFPTDLAIVSILYRIAAKNNIKYIFVGNNFRTEGRQPDLWTNSDGRQMRYINNKFGKGKFVSYPNQTIFDLIYFAGIKRIKMIRPFYYLSYNKTEAKKLIIEKYNWVDYGGHHHENIFTRFIIGYWLTQKFGIDKRKVTYSAYIRNGEITRDLALENIQQIPYDLDLMQQDLDYVIKKLGVNESQFKQIWTGKNKTFHDYPSYYPIYKNTKWISNYILRFILPFKPMMTFEVKKNKYNKDKH
jgi:N-acetyl sugar amidotransferase